MNQPPLVSSPPEEIIAIVGVGLIGGSLAAALRQRKAAKCVIGVGRDASRLEAARQAGLIDEGSTDLADVACRATLIVFCTPVERIADEVRIAYVRDKTRINGVDHVLGIITEELSSTVTPQTNTPQTKKPINSINPGKPVATQVARLRPTVIPQTKASGLKLLLTDAGSVKGPICAELADIPNFLGAHPIAGSHRQGFEAADANLFEGKLCVLTPQASASPSDLARLERFWQSVGMRTATMTPDDHDAALAMTSHLPHVVASSLAATLSPENRPLTGSGFRDTTRIAAGDPDLWTGILMSNAEHVLTALERFQHRFAEFRAALVAEDAAAIQRLLAEGQRGRLALNGTSGE